MGSGATKREILENKLEKRLQDPKTPLISLPLDFLEDITCGFSTERILGTGGCGVVYKGVLRSGKTIAVKKIFDRHLLDNDNQVENEIICLTEVRHQNIVQLVGYCVETKSELMEHSGKHVMAEKRACLLCFEFLCNGSLDKHLSDETSGLDWDERYKIIRGVCRCLHYLHDKHRIVHRDLKPQNILMDDMMMPKIGDFDLSRILGQEKSRTITANFVGTLGYMAPECVDQRSISFKADIFSFGVIIIEIITGHRDYPNISEITETSLKHYTDEVVGSWRNRLIEITPMHMSPEMCIHQVQQCISIALKCLESESNKRPTSLDIVHSLNALEPICTSPGNPPSVVEKVRINQHLQSQVNVNTVNIPKTSSAINRLNECTNLFQWVTSAISSPKPQLIETQKEKLHGDVRQLQHDLQCLIDTLPDMYILIDRAEWRIHDHYVAELLSRLKHAVYDAEDILDEFRWYESKLSIQGTAISVEPVIDFFHSVTQGSFNNVTNIQERLNHLSKQLEKMGLLHAVPQFNKSFRPETTSFPTEAKIFGRDEEKNKLIRLLGVRTNNSAGPSRYKRKRSRVCSSADNQICATIDTNDATVKSVPVLPIVGIGGVGKTTLAQDICNNSKVIRHFELIIWICVSDDFDVKRLTKEALEQTSRKVLQNSNLNSLQLALAKRLKNKRFLLVLDDMWNENELDWERFCAPFRNVLQGSMMLVTTRSPKVANVVRTIDPFPLEGLKEDVFWKFFKLCLFGSDSSNNYPELEQIGEKILPRLKGTPLAAKTLGRLLGLRLDQAHWNMILKSELWEHKQEDTDILPALRLSYMYLPYHLKRCFAFCLCKSLPSAFCCLYNMKIFYAKKWEIDDIPSGLGMLINLKKFESVKCQFHYAHSVGHLVLRNYNGESLPSSFQPQNSVTKSTFLSLTYVVIRSCQNLSSLEQFLQPAYVPIIKTIEISECESLESIPTERFGDLRFLEELSVSRCPNIESRHIVSPSLKKLSLEDSGNLGYNIECSSLTVLHFSDRYVESIELQMWSLPLLKELLITFCDSLTSIRDSDISTDFFQGVSKRRMKKFTYITHLNIEECRNLETIDDLLHLPTIERIVIMRCGLLSLPANRFGTFPLLKDLDISLCQRLDWQSGFRLPSRLKKLWLSNCGDFSAWFPSCLENLTSLELLQFFECECIVSFPGHLWSSNLRSLQKLKFYSCPNLKSIGGPDAIAHIRDLCIDNCRELKEIDQPLRTGKFS